MARSALPAAALILMAALAAGFLPGGPRAAAARGRGPKRFTHWDHVRAAWFRGAGKEVPRDCRGCHDYSSERPRDPLAVCADCHRTNVTSGAATLTLTEAARERWKAVTGRREHGRTFRHEDHAKQSCRSCHQPRSAESAAGGVRDEMVRLAGVGACTACHDPEQAASRPDGAGEAEIVKRFLAALNERLMEHPEAFFDHAQHLPRGVVVGGERPHLEACLACHRPLASDPDRLIGKAELDGKACGKCHLPRGKAQSVDFGLQEQRVGSPTKMVFLHRPHLQPEALKDADLAEGCLACHGAERVEGRLCYPPLEKKFGKGVDTYESCVSCHGHARRSREEGLRHEEGHADGCVLCHVMGAAAASFKKDRPGVRVRRPAVGRTFRITRQAHPFITGESVDQDCRRCHRACLPELPSRVQQRPFSHVTHLQAKPGADACAACHPLVRDAATPEALALYDPAACKACHLGEEVPSAFAPAASEERVVPAFPHARHLGKEAQQNEKIGGRGCLACHGPAAGAWGVTAGTRDEARACTGCHDHAKAPEITGKKSEAYVKTCATCHGDVIPDPRTKVRPANTRVVVTRAVPAPRHPEYTETPCATCHALAWTEPRKEPGDRTLVERPGFVHKDPRSRYVDAGSCGGCHWSDAFDDPTRREPGSTVEQLFERFRRVTKYGSGS